LRKIAVGTAQFGLDYGVSNLHGQTSRKDVFDILDYAYANGIRVIDTASMYGNAEQVVGAVAGLEKNARNWKIITKTPHFKVDKVTNEQIDELERSFDLSLKNLNCSSIYGLLIHACDDLFVSNGARLFEAVQRLKERGLVEKIGVSLYSGDQIDQLLDSYPVDLVQLPFNILDQRLLKSGHLQKLQKRGVEIHARSAFLQGLLLMEPLQRSSWFAPISEILDRFHLQAQQRGLTRLELALGYVQSITEIDRIVIGVNTLEQLREIVEATTITVAPSEFNALAIADPSFVNPSNWRL